LSGKLAHYSDRQGIPKVGDWVAVRVSDNGYSVIEACVARRGEIARKVTGKRTVKQVIAANVDIAFVLLALDNDFNVDRLRRFLYQLSINDIKPVIVLNKADKTNDVDGYISQLSDFDLPIIPMIATEGKGIDVLLEHIKPGATAILLGSSGVGKSTITNQLLGREVQKTQAVRESDDTGKHTTVHRELFVLKNGGLLIDTPGIRELQLWGTEEELKDNYEDVAELVSQCKYTTCKHGDEEGCAIRFALQQGTLDRSRYEAYLKMQAELIALHKRTIVKDRLANAKSFRARKRQKRDEMIQAREDLY